MSNSCGHTRVKNPSVRSRPHFSTIESRSSKTTRPGHSRSCSTIACSRWTGSASAPRRASITFTSTSRRALRPDDGLRRADVGAAHAVLAALDQERVEDVRELQLAALVEQPDHVVAGEQPAQQLVEVRDARAGPGGWLLAVLTTDCFMYSSIADSANQKRGPERGRRKEQEDEKAQAQRGVRRQSRRATRQTRQRH